MSSAGEQAGQAARWPQLRNQQAGRPQVGPDRRPGPTAARPGPFVR